MGNELSTEEKRRERRLGNSEKRQNAATTSRTPTTATSSSYFSTASPVHTSAASSRVVTGSGVPHPFTSAQTSAPHMPSAPPLSAMSPIQLQDQRPPQPYIFTQSELETRIRSVSLYPDLGGPSSQTSQRSAPSNGTSNRDSATASTGQETRQAQSYNFIQKRTEIKIENRNQGQRLFPDVDDLASPQRSAPLQRATPTQLPTPMQRHTPPQRPTPPQQPILPKHPTPPQPSNPLQPQHPMSPQCSTSPQRPTPSNSSVHRHSIEPSTQCIGDYDDLSLSCACCGQRLRTSPIYQCSGGHSSCTECRAAACACGVCTNPVTDMRSFELEEFIAQMKIRCPNAKNGCKRMLTVDEEEAHARECRFGDTPELRCPVEADSSCPWIGKTNMFANHFKQYHSELCGTVGTERTLPGFALNFDHTRVFLLTIGIYHFVLHIEVAGGILRMAVQLVGTTFNANKWIYELHVYNQAEPHRQYFYSDSCSAIGAPSPLGAVLACAYAASFLNCNELVYKVYIKKQYKDHDSDRKPPINLTRDQSLDHDGAEEPSNDHARRQHLRQRVNKNKRLQK